MNLFDFLEPLMARINETLELVEVAMSENDTQEAKKLMDEAKTLSTAKQELLKAIHAKFGERLLSPETKKLLESLGRPPEKKIDMEKEMKMFGPKDRVKKEKPLDEIPILKTPVPYFPKKPSDDLDEAPIDLTSSEDIAMFKAAAEGKSELRLLLYFLRALSQIYQHMHWRSAGPNYYGDHLLYERLYNETSDEIDQIAEKTIGITDNSASISPTEDVKYTTHIVNKFVGGEFIPEGFAETAILAEKELIKLIEKLMSGENSDGVENMLQGVADKHEGHLYLLQQRNKSAAVLNDMVKLANHLDSIGETDLATELDEALNIIAMAKNNDEIAKEMAQIRNQIEKIELRGASDSSDHESLSFLRQKYNELGAERDHSRELEDRLSPEEIASVDEDFDKKMQELEQQDHEHEMMRHEEAWNKIENK